MKKRNLVLFGTVATLSLALAGSIGAVTASAANITNGGTNTGTTTVKHTASDSWTVTIPDTITIGSAQDTDKVSASDVTIAEGKELNVKVKSANGWYLKKEGAGTGIKYTLKGDSSPYTNDAEVLTVAAGGEDDEVTLTAEIDANNKYSTGGEEYTDTLTFTVSVDDAE